jgi:cytochrome P450
MARTTAPGPRGKPFVGDLLAYQYDRIGWLRANRDRYGDVVRLAPKIVAVHHPELAHQVLAGTDDGYAVDPLLRSTRRDRRALEAYQAEWTRVRRGVWRSLSARITQLHLARFTTRLGADLAGYADRPVDVLAACRLLLGRAIVDFCVGGGADRSELDELYGSADELFHTALAALVGGEGRTWWSRRPAGRAAVRANQRLLDQLGGLVARRSAGRRPAEPRDLLDLLLGPGRGEPDAPLVAMLRTVIFASHGVPGTALAWIMLSLAAHPAAAAAVAAEGAALRHGDLRALDALPQTGAYIREVLRLHPPQWLITRSAVRPAELGGERIPAGTEVLVCAYLLHRDPRWWTDPDEFRPARWLARDLPHARYAYLPFGAGPRVCPGSHLALTHLAAVTALVTRDYHLRLPLPGDVPATYDGLFAPVRLRGGWWSAAANRER